MGNIKPPRTNGPTDSSTGTLYGDLMYEYASLSKNANETIKGMLRRDIPQVKNNQLQISNNIRKINRLSEMMDVQAREQENVAKKIDKLKPKPPTQTG